MCVLPENHLEPHEFSVVCVPLAPRAAGALRHVATMIDATIKAYQGARDIASEEGSPLPSTIDEQIVAVLVQADCLLRTQATLRAVYDARPPRRPVLVTSAHELRQSEPKTPWRRPKTNGDPR